MSAWADSPTRLREDAATEADLVHGGYRDRLLTELAQNAADAAERAGVPGRVWVRLHRDREDAAVLSVANIGAPLDRAGVQAMCALRASSKSAGVGRYGVGFTAVLTVSDEITVLSRSGSLHFSKARTLSSVSTASITVPAEGVPVLRLPWATEQHPSDHADTEILLELHPAVDPERLLAQMQTEAAELLLELPALHSIEVGDREFVRTETRVSDAVTEVGIGDLRWWRYQAGTDLGVDVTWMVPTVDGVVSPLSADVLRAPTRSDEELSLPAMVIARVPLQPDRRRILPGTDVGALGATYPGFLAALPSLQRTRLVPLPGFARSEVDERLRASVLEALRVGTWLPAAEGADLRPDRATAVPELSPELATALADVIPGLVHPDIAGPLDAPALAALGVQRYGLADIAERLGGVDREPRWWATLYDALEPFVVDNVAAQELSAIPVPLADGRVVTGPRTVVVGIDLDTDLVRLPWLRLVHPDANHPLLARLGAQQASAAELLDDPALRAAVLQTNSEEFDPGALDAEDPDPMELATTVLSLVCAAGEHSSLPSWLGELLLADEKGELRSADELLLPQAPLRPLLDDDSPFELVDQTLVDRVGPHTLRRVGVGWGFSILRVEFPTGPDHDLDDEEQWWHSLRGEPEELLAVRDLELVGDDRWPQALRLLASEAATRELLVDSDGYTCWWLRHHARIGGEALGTLRAANDRIFEGLLNPVEFDVPAGSLAPQLVETSEMARVLLDRLGDAARNPTADVVVRTHTLLAEAVLAGRVELDDLNPPNGVRSVAGVVADPAEAMVLDRPWFGAALPQRHLVLGPREGRAAAALADLLDIRLTSDVVTARVVSTGQRSSWEREPGAVLACWQLGLALPSGELTVHEELVIAVNADGEPEREQAVPWWVDERGGVHCTPAWERPRV